MNENMTKEYKDRSVRGHKGIPRAMKWFLKKKKRSGENPKEDKAKKDKTLHISITHPNHCSLHPFHGFKYNARGVRR